MLDHDGVEPQEITCAELESLVGELQRYRLSERTTPLHGLSDERLVTLADHDGVEPQEITCAELESLIEELQQHHLHAPCPEQT